MSTVSSNTRVTYRINISREIGGIRALIIRVIDGRYIGHEAQVRLLIRKLIQREFQVRCWDQTDQYPIPQNREAAVEFASCVKTLELPAQTGGWNKRRIRNVNDPFTAKSRYNIREIGREDGFVLVVQERVRIQFR